MRADGSSLSDIINHFNAHYSDTKGALTRQALIHCLERSAIALRWDKGMKGGGDHYLSAPDFQKLKTKVIESANDDEHLDPESLLNLRLTRRSVSLSRFK